MARVTPLHDEPPSKQEQQCRALGADLYIDHSEDDDDAPGYGSDPFDILAHKESQELDDA